MRIKVINANTTASMTAKIGECARAAAGPGVTVDAVSPRQGPAAIESHTDEAFAVPGVLEEIAAGEAAGYDGYVIACFGDPGLKAARELAVGPVVGIAEAGIRVASYLGRGFSIVTTLSRSVGHTRDLLDEYGAARSCLGIHATDLAVLDLETDPVARATILRACEEALAKDGSDAIVLGCAGMADLCHDLSAQLGVSVVDGVAAATITVEGLIRMRLTTGKGNEFAYPPARLEGERLLSS
ncbi:aspartate/glutamate racemase family protein [Streptomyces sp. SID13031]|uniref:aspartate/glutamate racemase family protein n=1 Tax=Streptomyces sp. SID13031 TaxID=2706046 RepID=UPI0013C662ED|nr:aspartate/glutamate racemase family protein [Streptomyces sp. SID13031]NEA30546.1 Asp/Glu racemase [Streptomyces sp. SID13031]